PRSLAQTEAYIYLPANPYPPFYVGDTSKAYPVDLEIDPPAPQHRAVTFFRIFLAIPAFLLSGALGASGSVGGGNGYYRLAASGGIATTAAMLIWFSALVRGRAPRGLRDLVTWGIGYGAQVGCYLFLLTDRYPNSDPRLHLAAVQAAGVGAEGEPPPGEPVPVE